jgi:glucose/arabinose dehydrogenase
MKATQKLAALFLLASLLAGVRVAAQDRSTAALTLTPVLSNLSSPVFVTNAHDGSNRLFVVEQPGRVQVLQPGASAPTVFLDISTKVLFGGERGLLGLTFHPQFNTNHRFFVNYTRKPDGATVIAEYHASATNPNLSDAGETVLLVIQQPFENHNGGMIEFGPDGFLYVGMGDGGSANDPGNRAQNVDELLGKILRLDVDHPNGSTPYSSPPDNPFFGATPGRDEIYAVGMRNPFRFSFDRATGQLYVGDVGQDVREEIDVVTRGGNYGWRVFEGTRCTGLGPAACVPANFQPPIAEYDHTAGRCSISGGYVYRGKRATLPPGSYVYGDFCTGELFLLQGGAQSLLQDTTLNISSFGEDEGGELYVVGLGGTVHRLSTSCAYAASPAAPQDFPANGGQGSFNILTDGGCPWTATSLVPWITITQGSGSGNGTVSFTVAANGGAARAGQIVYGDNSSYTIRQAAAPTTLQFAAASLTASEASGSAQLAITRSGDTSAASTVNVRTVDDTRAIRCDDTTSAPGVAFARCDYATTVGTLAFAPGETQKTISVSLINDSYVEPNENVTLALSNPVGATLGSQGTTTLTITSDDAAGQPNPITRGDQFGTDFFVRQHYLDFLSREPEAGQPWSAVLNGCANQFNTDPASASASCDRIHVSASFFLSDEFKLKGFFVFDFYRVALARLPFYAEIVSDMSSITATTTADVNTKKAAFTTAFAQRQEFKNLYDAMDNQTFVNTLMNRYGNLPSITTLNPASPDDTSAPRITFTRADLINRLNGVGGSLTRAQVVRAIADSSEVGAAEFNTAFVAMQYFGYLRRDPDTQGFNDWLRTINANPADFRSMVNGFMNSQEYRLRFGTP